MRIKKGLTQKQLAEKVGRTEKYISNLETGTSPSCSLSTFVRLANVLDLSADYLLAGVIKYRPSEDIDPLDQSLIEEIKSLSTEEKQYILQMTLLKDL